VKESYQTFKNALYNIGLPTTYTTKAITLEKIILDFY